MFRIKNGIITDDGNDAGKTFTLPQPVFDKPIVSQKKRVALVRNFFIFFAKAE